MAKPGRTATMVEHIKPQQCIEIDSQHIFRISTITPAVLTPEGKPERAGYILSTYREYVQFWFEEHALVDVVDTHTRRIGLGQERSDIRAPVVGFVGWRWYITVTNTTHEHRGTIEVWRPDAVASARLRSLSRSSTDEHSAITTSASCV